MFERLNQALLRHLDRRRGVRPLVAIELTSDGFALLRQTDAGPGPARTEHAWNDVRRAVALMTPGLVGGDECLLVETADATLQLGADVRGFDALVTAAPARLDGWREAAQWRVALAAVPVGEPVEVYRVTTAAA